MGFNLATFLAQLLNLFILIWLLKRFLYRPILAIIDKRRQEIALNIQQAEEKLASAANLEQDLSSQKQALEAKNQQYLDTLQKEVAQQKDLMMKELELNYLVKRDQLQEDLKNAWDNATNSINAMIASEFMTLSQKVLAEWSKQTAMDQVLLLFKKKVQSLTRSNRLSLQNILSQQKILVIHSSEKLSKKQQDFVKTLLSQNFNLPPKIRFQFKEKNDLILGIEMRLDTFTLDWSLKTYLEEVNQRIKQNISGLISPVKGKVSR